MITAALRPTVALAVLASLAGVSAPATADEERDQARTSSPAPSGWDMALTAGFVVCGLTDPVYALGNVTGQPSRVVLRRTDRESSANLGIAMFGHVYHDRYPWIAPLSFGLGIRGDSRATVYLGSALRLGSHTSFAAGVAVGPVATLPAGVDEGRTLTDTNFLSNLVTRTTLSWFTAGTYTFGSLR